MSGSGTLTTDHGGRPTLRAAVSGPATSPAESRPSRGRVCECGRVETGVTDSRGDSAVHDDDGGDDARQIRYQAASLPQQADHSVPNTDYRNRNRAAPAVAQDAVWPLRHHAVDSSWLDGGLIRDAYLGTLGPHLHSFVRAEGETKRLQRPKAPSSCSRRIPQTWNARYASRKAVLASQRVRGRRACRPAGRFWGVVALQRGLGTFRQHTNGTNECLLHRLHQQSWRAATATPAHGVSENLGNPPPQAASQPGCASGARIGETL